MFSQQTLLKGKRTYTKNDLKSSDSGKGSLEVCVVVKADHPVDKSVVERLERDLAGLFTPQGYTVVAK